MVNSLNDGLGKPDQLDTGAIDQAEIGSGAILSAHISGAQVLKSHIASGNVLGPQISGAVIVETHIASGAILGPHISGAVVLKSHIASGNVLGPQISGGVITNSHLAASTIEASSQGFVGTGSPTGFGLAIQTGSLTMSDVVVTAQFGTAFAAAPFVILTPATSGALATAPGMVVGTAAGSFTALGQSGLLHSYIAIGSGNI